MDDEADRIYEEMSKNIQVQLLFLIQKLEELVLYLLQILMLMVIIFVEFTYEHYECHKTHQLIVEDLNPVKSAPKWYTRSDLFD